MNRNQTPIALAFVTIAAPLTVACGPEIVLIASADSIDRDDLQRAFDNCIGTGDETQSPILGLSRQLHG